MSVGSQFPDLISPAAMGLLPAVILHAVIFAYFIHRKNKSRSTWLLTGWMTTLLLLMVSQFTARVIYHPLSGYIDWIGGITFSWLGLILILQFAYHFPCTVYAREARGALLITSAIGVGLGVMMLFEATLTVKPPVYNFSQLWLGHLARYQRPHRCQARYQHSR